MMSTTAELPPLDLAALSSLSVSELRERYAQVYGEPTRSGNKQWLLRRVAWRMQALREGDLSERARRRAAELARDVDVRVRPPKGDDRDATRAPAPRVLSISGQLTTRADRRLPPPGTVLRRTHKGVEHLVTVLADGFEYEGRVHRSLTSVATAITGSHWNGYLFFGLTAKESA